ncbi:ASCH domain-containing protein, partial [Microcoleus sp. Pol11C1]|uniref:ASCH domain-containing protein n=1 Tax=unclassified Microcoleus TaxID=2642155 RepID=UPI002FD053A0
MCINSKIQQKLDQKAALDAEIAKLEALAASTIPVKNLLSELLANYAQEAPEDLSAVWQEVLAIGQQYNLSVQPLAVDEVKQWEAANREVEYLRSQVADLQFDSEKFRQEHSKITERHLELLGASSERVQQLSAENAELRSQISIEPDTESETQTKSIPALTLWQPWASLIQHEVKRTETRSWSTNYRGPIAIHAAKKPADPSDCSDLFKLLPANCEFLPLGAVVAIANLIDCVEMTPEFIAQQSEQELKCGDWQPGRFAWVLEIIRPVVPPIPATGGQKLWNWSGTSIEAELEYLEKLKAAPEYEPEECCDTVESILEAEGFSKYDPDMPPDWDTSELYENYRGWDVFYSFPNGGIVAIGLNSSKSNQFWDASTEYIQEIEGNTFPESLADYDEIVAWTKQLIDRVVAVTPVESLEAPGQQVLPLEFPEVAAEKTDNTVLAGDEYDAAVEEELALDDEELEEAEHPKPVIDNALDFETLGFQVMVCPSHGGGELTGVTFRVTNPEEKGADGKPKLMFSKSLLAAELGDRPYKSIARTLIQDWRDSEAGRLDKIANPYKKPEDDFIELVKVSNDVGYLKRKDNGELIAAYAAFSNAAKNGGSTKTKAKSRAKKWAEWLAANFGWECSEPRVCKRMESDTKIQFAYEIKISKGFSIGQLQKLTEEDLELLPGEVAPETTPPAEKVAESEAQVFKVKINSYEATSGTEQEMRSRFEHELKDLGGSQMSVSLLTGS